MDATFSVVDFSFILAAKGDFHCAGRCVPVEALCVLMNWPGAQFRFGAEPAGAT